jgi:hypothetical protein
MNFLTRYWKPLLAVLAVALLLGWCWKRERNAEQRGAAQGAIERDRPLVEEHTDSMEFVRPALDTITRRITDTVFVRYDSIRTRVVRVPYNVPGTSDTVTMALVDTVFVAAADSLRQACGLLELNCSRFRLHADSVIAAQGRVITNLQIVEKKSGGWTKALQWFGMGAAAGVALGVYVSR